VVALSPWICLPWVLEDFPSCSVLCPAQCPQGCHPEGLLSKLLSFSPGWRLLLVIGPGIQVCGEIHLVQSCQNFFCFLCSHYVWLCVEFFSARDVFLNGRIPVFCHFWKIPHCIV
jgi:hypothetical protein